MDLASASQNDNTIAWYENTDGKGTFGSQQIVTTAGGALAYLRLTWTEMETWTWQVLLILTIKLHGTKTRRQKTFSQQIDGTYDADSVFAADLDGEDMDLVSGKIAWYENMDGKGTLEVKRSY